MENRKKGTYYIGTSGVGVMGNKDRFPEEFKQKTKLCYYSEVFNTVEVNSTHYKIPRIATFERWSSEVRQDFRFTLKLWREVTHAKELKMELSHIDLFFNAAKHIGKKKACLLVQFPGKISLDYYSHVEQILEHISELNEGEQWKIAVEFRNTSWQESETYELLKEHESALVLHDHPKWRDFEFYTETNFVYYRFHGPAGDYKGSYNFDFLLSKADDINRLLEKGKDVYVYFNNTAGDAFTNAITLKEMIGNNNQRM
ncbi:MAG: DUF72 domain-containing protein [Candidatus Dadabacteria bacterium]